MGGRSGLHKLGIVIFFDQVCKGRLVRLDLQDFWQVQIGKLRLTRHNYPQSKNWGYWTNGAKNLKNEKMENELAKVPRVQCVLWEE